jgi:protein gp37
VFTCSISDFFSARADEWRAEAWKIIHDTPSLVWFVLTKRPERIASHLPPDWGMGYPNVWLGTSTGCRQTLNKMDTLCGIPAALRFVSVEPLLEDISRDINLEGFGWIATGGESGSGPSGSPSAFL